MDSDSNSGRRADARRNRERLIATARELFAEHGTGVALADVARAAGVGVGTAYRHFPTVQELVEATYRDEVDRLADAAETLLRERPPGEALAAWLHACIDLLETERGLSDALQAVVLTDHDVHADSRAVVMSGLARLLAAAQEAGAARTDVDATDVAALLGGVFLVSDRGRAHRLLDVLIDGVRRG
ncbi:TetR family transcriptional regulator [Solirubrobacter pauli]|uniref:TetR family transcriptional regulator n=1 Tax=Solirubrobacter pauli TaxID=166793 RepID=A0A660LIA2_9ACTN|nr:TetR/AcrR family transcriptional regulator [Solirubrobacter pauli]RKQ92814.1 TetR family transcriptional regulator [Solirubrobacter pauli]